MDNTVRSLNPVRSKSPKATPASLVRTSNRVNEDSYLEFQKAMARKTAPRYIFGLVWNGRED